MVKRIVLIISLCCAIQSCSSSKPQSNHSPAGKLPVKKEGKATKISQSVIKSAQKYRGTKYKYGGDSKRGMDCSGLIYAAFSDNAISVPRSTSQLKSFVQWIVLKEVKSGDLVYFATKKHSRKVNHVGIVTQVTNGDLKFIHASSSKGVIESRLSQRYWYFAFVQARRVMQMALAD